MLTHKEKKEEAGTTFSFLELACLFNMGNEILNNLSKHPSFDIDTN